MIDNQIDVMKTKMKARMNAKMNDILKQFADMFNLQQNINIVMKSVSQIVEHINFVSLNSSVSSASFASLDSSNSSISLNSFAFSASSASLGSLTSFNPPTSSAKQLRVENVEYFDLEIKQKNEKSRSPLILIINVNKYVYYTNVYTFVDKLKNLTKSHDVELIINVFIFCFRGDALM